MAWFDAEETVKYVKKTNDNSVRKMFPNKILKIYLIQSFV